MKELINSFHENGFLVVPDVLSKDQCEVLKNDLDQALLKNKKKIQKRMFEKSKANLELFWQEPIVTLAEKIIEDNGSDLVLPGEDLKLASKGFHQQMKLMLFTIIPLLLKPNLMV